MAPYDATIRRLARRDAERRARADEARAELIAALRLAQESGATVRELAELTGFSFQRIHQLVKEGAPK